MLIKRYLTRAEAAEYIGYSPQTLANLASKGQGPRFTKPTAPSKGAKTLYAVADLDHWVQGPQPPPVR
jgi:hypothetical protein